MRVYIGIDWGPTKHVLCYLNEAGAVIAQQAVEHSAEGFARFEAQREKLGVAAAECLVGIETAHSLLVDYLWGHGYSQLYVIPPSVVRSARQRYRQSGARNDASDAYVLADTLRTDRGRLQVWRPDHVLTREIRSRVSLLIHLTQTIVQLSNRLRAVLLRYYPAGLQAFGELGSQIALEFVRKYPTPEAGQGLSWEEFQRFAQGEHYSHPQQLRSCYARLQQAYPPADPDTVVVFQEEAQRLAALLLTVVRARNEVVREAGKLYRQHPDHELFDSLPGVGEILGPGLLAKFGDDRARFACAASVQALAGTCPVTDESSHRRTIRFRRACDREFRYLAHTWALASVRQSAWAVAYYESVLRRCRSKNAAYRRLANRWLAIVWKMWQTRQPYDEGYHLQQRVQHSQPKV
jgi:transposase